MPSPAPTIQYRKLGRHRAHGFWIRGPKNDRILLDTRLKGRHKLTITLHELLHALEPRWSESRVTKSSRMLSRKLWEAGYRCVDNRRH
jgi:ribosomal protein L34